MILTGCIDPGATRLVVLKDPEERLFQYSRAIDHWLTVPGVGPLVFVEGSRYPIPETFQREGLTILRKDVTEMSARYGKGRGELDLVNFALETFRFDYFAKCTGRLFVLDAERIIRRFQTKETNFFDAQWDWVDTRLFACSASLWNILADGTKNLDEMKGYCLEDGFTGLFRSLKIKSEWPAPVKFCGESGTHGEHYGDFPV